MVIEKHLVADDPVIVSKQGGRYGPSVVILPLQQAHLHAIDLFHRRNHKTKTRALHLLERIKDLRNRVSHHEPAWRMATPLTPADVNATLSVRVQEMCELPDAMAPDVTKLLDNSGLFGRLAWLLDPQTNAAFAGQHTIDAVVLRALSRKVRRLAKRAHRSALAPQPQPGKATALLHAGKTLMTVVPHW